ncbi:6782_t:CDS:10 [Paraglomus brasilianum]|uniref:6782_t:CDS:1 n=1 Tax=Paraglomus brasilianum TaxID=144538 RepID=A0A9N8VIL3_9GLOM|nr:6782_t:CDS:10 [Paraglomus brasilianum]
MNTAQTTEGQPIPDHTIYEKIDFLKESALLISLARVDAEIKETPIKSDIKDNIAALIELAEWYGLDNMQLEQVMDVVLDGELDERDNNRLVKSLIPRDKVQEIMAIHVLGHLGRSPPEFTTQALLLQWVVIVYKLLDSHEELQLLYGVVFHYLEFDTLSLDLQSRIGDDPPLMGLLTVYKGYFPNLVLIEIPKSRKLIFKCPDVEWKHIIDEVQKRWSNEASLSTMESQQTALEFSEELSEELSSEESSVGPSVAKKRKTRHVEIPQTRTLDVTEKSVTLEEVGSFKDLVSNIDKLQLPSQLAAVLDNRMLQHMVACNPDETTKARISHWLYQCIMELLYWSDQTPETQEKLGDLLGKVVRMTEFMKELLPVFNGFLVKYIKCWDGKLHRKHIFQLLEYVKPEPFDDFYRTFLAPLKRLFCVSSVTWKARLLRSYTGLLKYWVFLYRLQGSSRHQNMETQLGPAELVKSINRLVTYVDRVALLALEVENDNVEIQHAILLFYEALSSLQLEHSWGRIIIPSSATIYRCFFSVSGMPLSRICNVVLHYKEAFDLNDQRIGQRGVIRHNRDYLNYFNSFVMDLCNCIWRNRAFNKVDRNSRGFQLEDETIEVIKGICGEQVGSSFSLTLAPALSAYSKDCFKQLERSSPQITRMLTCPVTYPVAKENENYVESRIAYVEIGKGDSEDTLFQDALLFHSQDIQLTVAPNTSQFVGFAEIVDVSSATTTM